MLALCVSIPPLLPGFINAINPLVLIGSSIHAFQLAFILGFSIAFAVYIGASYISPPEETFVAGTIYGYGTLESEKDEEGRRSKSEMGSLEEGSLSEKGKGEDSSMEVVPVVSLH